MNSRTPDRSVAALPVTGPNPARANFFRECASAFEFLALYHTLAADDQRALMEVVQSFQSHQHRKASDPS